MKGGPNGASGRRWRYDEAFTQLTPNRVAKASQEQGVSPPQLAQFVGE